MRCRYLVAGQVQGVGYRMFVRRHASRLGLVGFTRNLPDGRVEVVVDGPAEAHRVLEEALGNGPLAAQVSGVEKSEILDEVTVFKAFEIR
jgi:acylphosphatase